MPINQINLKLLLIILLLVFGLVIVCVYSACKINSIKNEAKDDFEKMDNLTFQLRELQEKLNITDGKKEALEEYLTR